METPATRQPRIIGVVSDTHGHVAYTRQGLQMLESFEVEAVLHCGDIGGTEVVPLFARWPTHFVLGNVDLYEPELETAIRGAGQQFHGRFGRLQLGGRRIALVHGDDFHALAAAVASGEHDLVCTGHTHLAKQERRGATLVLNPGALYRAQPHTVAIVDLETLEATHLRVD